MKTGYKPNPSQSKKGYDVNVVNTPTVKIDHSSDSKPMPSLHLTSENLADISSWEVGKKYTLTLEVEQTSKRKGDYSLIDSADSETKDNPVISADFKILNVKGK